jgi:Bacterial EndoU nuclease
MALDSYDDGVDGGKHLRGGGPDAGAAAARIEPAETRTRQECYEALRAADGKPVQASDDQRGSAARTDAPGEARTDAPAEERSDVPAEARTDVPGEARTDVPSEARTDVPSEARTDVPSEARTEAPGEAQTDRSGWDAVDSGQRPPLDAIRITPERSAHILDGDSTGGGHRHGTGKPGKTEFPVGWDDEKVTNVLLDVARRPDQQPGQQKWNDRWVARGTRDDVEVVVVISGDGRIWTGWPNPGGSGVIKNPEES